VKEGIHPQYKEVEARCACGNTFKTRSTKPELHLEICSACHPFFTGRQKLIDTEGRVERFSKKFGAQTSEQRKVAAKAAKATKAPVARRAKAQPPVSVPAESKERRQAAAGENKERR
jgi:large subunit ribosomal protein L31